MKSSSKWCDKSSWWDDYKINGSRYNSGNGYFSPADNIILEKMRENIREVMVQTDLTKIVRYQKEKEDELDTSFPIFWGGNGGYIKGLRILEVLETLGGYNKYNYDCCLLGYIYGISKNKNIICFSKNEIEIDSNLILDIEDFLKL